jgi:uncharacterized cupredoxin-like copper-binding protein
MVLMTTMTPARFGMPSARSTVSRLARSLAVLLAVALLAACASQSGDAGWTYAPASATPAASASGSPGASPSGSPGASPSGSPAGSPGGSSATGTTIELEETADLRIKQNGQNVTQLQVRGGETYTFRVANTANLAHNFYIGTQQDLQANNRANLEGIPDFNSGTQEFRYQVPQSGTLQFACTVPGHYTTMHGDLTIQ